MLNNDLISPMNLYLPRTFFNEIQLKKSSGSAFSPLSLSNALVWYSPSATYAITDAAADLDGASSERFTHSQDTAFDPGSEGFSVCAWVNPTSYTGTQAIMGKNSTGSSDSWLFYFSSAGNIIYNTRDHTENEQATVSQSAETAGSWAHYCAWWDPADGKSRLTNNAQATPAVSTVALTNFPKTLSRDFEIGAYGGGIGLFTGGIQQALIFKGYLLTSDDRTWLYNSGNGRSATEVTTRFGSNVTEGWMLHEETGAAINFVSSRDLTRNNTPDITAGAIEGESTLNAPIKRWEDRSTNASHATQSSASLRGVWNGSGIDLANEGEYLEVATSNLVDGQSDGTIAIKFNVTLSGQRHLYSNWAGGGILIRTDGNHLLVAWGNNSSKTWTNALTGLSGTDIRLIITRSGSTVETWLNGTSLGTHSQADHTGAGNASTYIGDTPHGGASMKGIMKHVAVYSDAKSNDDIASLDEYLQNN